jgi:predicted DsbA family dithiol-disulfide isomerase
MKITYYLDVTSSWCFWVEPVWTELKQHYAGKVDFDWKIALMSPRDFPANREQCDWFYRRSGTVMRSPFMLSSGWLEEPRRGDYRAPNLVAEAAKDFGITDDRARLALSYAAVRDGRKIGDIVEAVAAVSAACGIDPAELRIRAETAEVAARVQISTDEFHALRVTQRPAFLLEDPIGDRAVFSGLVAQKPLSATLDAMLADTAAYAAHAAHFGGPPKA